MPQSVPAQVALCPTGLSFRIWWSSPSHPPTQPLIYPPTIVLLEQRKEGKHSYRKGENKDGPKSGFPQTPTKGDGGAWVIMGPSLRTT